VREKCETAFHTFLGVFGGLVASVCETRGGVCTPRVAERLKTPDFTHEKTQKFFQKNRKISCIMFLRVIY
jgi:hypothetical protein